MCVEVVHSATTRLSDMSYFAAAHAEFGGIRAVRVLKCPGSMKTSRDLLRAPTWLFGIAALAAVALAFARPVQSQAPEARGLDGVSGTWRLATPNAEGEIDRSIARVVDRMSFFIRGIAQSRIDESVNPERVVRIEPHQERVRVALDDWGPVELSLDGRQRRARSADGQPLRVRAALQGEHLTLVQAANEGARVSYFSGARGGDTMRMTVRVQSPRLPEDIVYRLDYRRVR